MTNLLIELPNPPQGKTGWPWTEGSDSIPERMPDGSEWPKISIVTPSYNQAQYLEETIRSVLLQGYPNLEYIIIDGGSTDGSVEIIKKYEPWLSYWVSEPDRGQSHAINKGFERSTGEIMAWINSDDYYKPNAFKNVVDIYKNSNNTSLAFIHGKSIIINSDNYALSEKGSEFNFINSLKNSTNPIAQSSVFLIRDKVKSIGYLDETLHMSMDWDLYVRLALEHSTLFTTQILSFFRQSETTKTSLNKVGFGPDMVKVLNKVYQNNKIAKSLIDIKSEAYSSAYIRCIGGYIRINNKNLARKSFIKALLHKPSSALTKSKKYYRYLFFSSNR